MNKRLKKAAALILCLTLLFSCALPVHAQEPDEPSVKMLYTDNAADAINSNLEQTQDEQTEKYFDSLLFKFTQFLNRVSFKIFDIPVIGGIIQGTLQILVMITLGPLFFMGMIGANVAGHIYDQFREWFAKPAK